MGSRIVTLVLFASLAVVFASCKKKSRPAAGGGNSNVPSAVAGCGIDRRDGQSDAISSGFARHPGPDGMESRLRLEEWRDRVLSRSHRPRHSRITIVTRRCISGDACKSMAKINRSEGRSMVDARPPTYEGRVTVPPGIAWFVHREPVGCDGECQARVLPGPVTEKGVHS